jgi:hypothetical protein
MILGAIFYAELNIGLKLPDKTEYTIATEFLWRISSLKIGAELQRSVNN